MNLPQFKEFERIYYFYHCRLLLSVKKLLKSLEIVNWSFANNNVQ